MQRYNQQFGNVGPMIKSDDGYWCKNEDAENILHWNEQSLFDVIKERNEEVVVYQEEIAQMQQDVQNLVDCCEEDIAELKMRNDKLFSLLVISTALNLMAITTIALIKVGIL